MQARLPAARHRACLKFAQVIAGPFAEQSDEKGAVACQSARVEVRPIVQMLDGLENARSGVGTNPGFIIDDSRYRLRRDLREIRDLLDGDGRGTEINGQCGDLGRLSPF